MSISRFAASRLDLGTVLRLFVVSASVRVQQLMATARQARPASRFDELRAEVVAWLTGAVAAALRPPSTLPFHEVRRSFWCRC